MPDPKEPMGAEREAWKMERARTPRDWDEEPPPLDAETVRPTPLHGRAMNAALQVLRARHAPGSDIAQAVLAGELADAMLAAIAPPPHVVEAARRAEAETGLGHSRDEVHAHVKELKRGLQLHEVSITTDPSVFPGGGVINVRSVELRQAIADAVDSTLHRLFPPQALITPGVVEELTTAVLVAVTPFISLPSSAADVLELYMQQNPQFDPTGSQPARPAPSQGQQALEALDQIIAGARTAAPRQKMTWSELARTLESVQTIAETMQQPNVGLDQVDAADYVRRALQTLAEGITLNGIAAVDLNAEEMVTVGPGDEALVIGRAQSAAKAGMTVDIVLNEEGLQYLLENQTEIRALSPRQIEDEQ